MRRRMHAALLSVLALILGTGALVLGTAGTASADLAGSVTLTPSSGTLTDAQPFSAVSVSAPCPDHYQDNLSVLVSIPDFGDSLIASQVIDGSPYNGSSITAHIPPAGPDGPPWVNTISDAFGNYGATPTDGKYAIKIQCGSNDPNNTDTPTFSTIIDISGNNWTQEQTAATPTTVALTADPAGHVVVSKSFTLTATVDPADADGSVQFLSNGSTPVALVPLHNGIATTGINGSGRAGGATYTAQFVPNDLTKFTSSTSTTMSYAVVNEPGITALDDQNNTLTDNPALTAGQKIKLTVQGFLPAASATSGESVTVAFDGSAGSLTKGTADDQGTVTNYAFTVPSDATNGSHTVSFKGDTSAIEQSFAFTVGPDDSGTTAGDTSGTTAGDTSGSTAGDTSGSTAGDTSGTTAGDTSGATAGTLSGGSDGSTGGVSGGTIGDLSGGSSSSGGSSGGGSGPLAATGAGGIVGMSALALLLLTGGGYAVYRVRRDGKLLTFGPGPRD